MPTGLGDEQLWLSATNDNTGTSTAFNDQSGQGNNGTAVGALVVADTSEGGSFAFDFDGFNDDIDCSNAVTLASNLLSVSTWINGALPTTNGVFRTLVSKGNISGETPFDLSFKGTGSSTNLRFFTFGGGSIQGISSYVTAMSSSQWHHVCGTYDNQTFRLYVDGVEVATAAWTGGLYDNSEDIRIGSIAINGVRQRYFDGMQDDVRIYNRVLNQAEITHLASQRGVEGPPPVGLGDEQLWLCPSLNDSAADISGSGNDGTYNGGMGTVADTSNGGSMAYDFDGSNDYIDCGSAISNTTFSMSGWFNTDTGYGAMAGSYRWQLSQRSFYIRLDSSTPEFMLGSTGGSSGNIKITSSSQVSTGTWYHIAATWDSTTGDMKLFLDGSLVASGTQSGMAALVEPLCLGSYSTVESFFNGKQDDIRFYQRVLTQAEITHLATSRGIEGSPSTTTQYNAFITHAFKQLFQARLR